jgi:hypothetical protein
MTYARTTTLVASIVGMVAASGAGCGGGTTAGNPAIDTSTSEIAASAISGGANSTEPGGTQASYEAAPRRDRFWALLEQALSPVSSCYAAGNPCPTLAGPHAAACSSGSVVMDYSSCTFGLSPTVWNGSQTVQFSSSCSSVTLSALNGQTLTRTFGAGTTETTLLGVVTTFDTSAAAQTSGWDTSVTLAGVGETAAFTGSSGNRTLTILGLHLTATYKGKTLYDHTVSSSGITITGSGTGRTISSGTVTVQHNLLHATAQASISTPLTYGIAACCHPDTGVIKTTLSGALTGTETLTFTGSQTGTCGSATLTDSSGNSSSVTLSHCF